MWCDMNTDDHKQRSLNILTITSLAVLLSGCVVAPSETSDNGNTEEQTEDDNQGDTEDGNENEIIGTAPTTATELGSNLEVSVQPLELIDGDLLRLNLILTNNSDSHYILQDALSDGENPYSASNTSLIDAPSQTRHLSHD